MSVLDSDQNASSEPASDDPRARRPEERSMRLRRDLVFESQNVGQQGGYLCHDPERGEFFRFGEREYQLAQLLDGQRTAAAVAALSQESDYPTDEIAVQKLLLWLVQQQLVENALDADDSQDKSGQELLQGLSKAISIRIPLLDANEPAKRLTASFGKLLSRGGFCIWLALVLAGVATISLHFDRFIRETRQVFNPSTWIWLGIVWCVIKVLHEAGHAVAASRQGVQVGRGGIILLLLAPIAYVDVTDSWKLKNRWSRIQIALGGVYIELLIAALASFIWAWASQSSSSGALSNLMLNIILAAGPTTILVNANPLMRLDGYFALADLTSIPNLAMHGNRQMKGWIEWMILGRRRNASMLVGWRRPFATAHAVASIVYKATWIVGLLMLVSTYFSGLGSILAVLAFVLWVLVPFARWIRGLALSEDRNRCFRRLAEVGMVLGFITIASTHITSPVGQSVPVIVLHKDHQTLRARNSGFVSQIHVQSGQHVAAGDLLLEITNRDLEVEYLNVSLEVKSSEIRSRQLIRQAQEGLAQAETQRLSSLQRRMAELKTQLDQQKVTAPADGSVLTANLERLLGSFVQVGDVMIEIGRPDEKELLASISQAQVSNYHTASLENQLSNVRFRGGKRLVVELVSSVPRGSTSLPHPALAATAGGPIAVEASTDSESSRDGVQMTEPRFEALIPVLRDAATELQSGQRGTLSLRDQRTVFELIRDRIYVLWQRTTSVLQDA